VEIEFDPVKRELILRRRGLDLAEAGKLLLGFRVDEPDERFDYGEERWVSLGLLRGDVVACVWVPVDETRVRVITMWKARRHEQEKYFKFWEGF
jgi:uncharacterized DUF497 family protein